MKFCWSSSRCPAGSPGKYFQIISYLKFWKKSLGLLVNFGQEKVKVERVPFAEKPFVSVKITNTSSRC